MNIRRIVCFVPLCLLFVFVASCSEPAKAPDAAAAPKITLSTDTVFHKGFVQMYGSGFTPKTEAKSHLRRPNGTEFPVLPIYTDEKGGFTHEVDSLLLLEGPHELWVIDGSTGVSSNVATFKVAYGQQPIQK